MNANVMLTLSLDSMEQDQLTTFILDVVLNLATGTENVECIYTVINNTYTLLKSEFHQDKVKASLPSTCMGQVYSIIQLLFLKLKQNYDFKDTGKIPFAAQHHVLTMKGLYV